MVQCVMCCSSPGVVFKYDYNFVQSGLTCAAITQTSSGIILLKKRDFSVINLICIHFYANLRQSSGSLVLDWGWYDPNAIKWVGAFSSMARLLCHTLHKKLLPLPPSSTASWLKQRRISRLTSLCWPQTCKSNTFGFRDVFIKPKGRNFYPFLTCTLKSALQLQKTQP